MHSCDCLGDTGAKLLLTKDKNTFISISAALLEPLEMSLRVQRPACSWQPQVFESVTPRDLSPGSGKKKSCDFACEIQLELVLNSPGHPPVYIRSYFIVHSGLENPTDQSKYLRGKSLHIEINSKVEVGCLLKQGWGSRAEQTSISFTLRPWLFSFFFLTYDWYLGPPAPLPSKGQTDLSCLTCKTE